MKKNTGSYTRRSKGPQDLESRLQRLLQTQETVEKTFREENQRLWAIMFIDASPTAEPVWSLGAETADAIFADYQSLLRPVLNRRNPTFVDPAGGPQMIACYEHCEDALETANDILIAMENWAPHQAPNITLTPSVGVHLGYVVYKEGKLLQSNTANMTKRIQTQAQPGQVLISEQVREAIQNAPHFTATHVGAFNLKNIPEPQDLYEVKMLSANNQGMEVRSSARDRSAAAQAQTKKQSHIWSMVYIDVVESTKKFWRYGDRQAIRLIEDYQKLCSTSFSTNRCEYQLSCEGDQIFAGFKPDDIDGSVAACIQIMQSLFRRNANVPENQQVLAAIGIHLGEVIFQGSEMMQSKDTRIGKAVQSMATASEILITQDVLNMLHPDFQQLAEYYDTCELSGISGEFEIYSMKWTGIQLNTTFLRQKLGSSSVIRGMRR